MTDRYDAARLHCEELDREIESIRIERVLRELRPPGGLIERARRRTGNALVAAGRIVAGPEPGPVRIFEA